MEKSYQEKQQSNHDISKVSHFFRKEIQQKIEQHPCYSKNAHQYARMHLPVAPACNIQCNYCNRKYDCSNESRPGVVSNIIDPNGALRQFNAIKKRVPNLSVVGIAGPGDALANPKTTFAALRLIRKHDPDVQLCISTNGLQLVDYVDQLVEVGVNHLTITINCIDDTVGEKIYPWIFFDHRRIKGREASKILIERQLEGLKAAAKASMLVKVNTVLIPGINDHHVQAVSEKVTSLGAMLHNIMPLISEPEHGTYFGLNNQRGPTDAEMDQARALSGINMAQMTHCKQCRADAVGTLSDEPTIGSDKITTGCGVKNDSSTNSTSENVKAYKVAIATKLNQVDDLIQTHFGYAEQFEIYQYNDSYDTYFHIETRVASKYCTGSEQCAENESYKSLVLETISDCDELLCSRIGIGPWRELEKAGVTPNIDFAFVSKQRALEEISLRLKKTQHMMQNSTGDDHEICHYG